MNRKLSITDLPIEGKKVLVRVDFNVPLDKDGRITDDTRIRASIPTIDYILQRGGYPILMSHLGRPKGPTPELSLKPVAKRLSDLMGRDVELADNCFGPDAEKKANSLKPGKILLLENLRFNPAEEHPELDPTFAKKIAALGDYYVNDAFGTAHRAHSSTVSIPQLFPNTSAAGFLLDKEIQFLGSTLVTPKLPFVALVGGAKVSSKLGVLTSLLAKADCILIGGAMAFTFLKAQGYSIGNSLFEEKLINEAKHLLKDAKTTHCEIFLPSDFVIAKEAVSGSETKIVSIKDGIPDGWMGVDIGPQTIKQFTEVLRTASTVFWNGPMGIFEVEGFAKGTYALAEVIAAIPANTIVGGGDTISAVHQAGVEEYIDHISTGGGASMEYIQYGTLPGIEALTDVLSAARR
jgi:phosphoglycerate kinase